MDAARWQRLGDLFATLREETPDARARALAQLEAEDPELAEEVRSLLAAEAQPGVLDAALLPPLRELLGEPLPERIGPYVVSGEIGRGGMGVVCRAYDPRLRREVALKLLPRSLVHDAAARERFLAEARAASALDHPHICTIHDVGEVGDGRLYLAMSLYAGGTVADRLVAGPLPVRDALETAKQVAGALHAAHEAGIVHRDVKPHNIAFDERGEVRLLDFGVATLGADAQAAESTAGTAAYMAPEQALGRSVDRRADVWALGAVLFEMLAGRRAFVGKDRATLLRSIREDPPPELREFAPHVPRGLDRVVARALEKDPRKRYATAVELQDALVAFSDASRPAWRTRGWRTVVAPSALVGAAALGVAGLLYVNGADSASKAEPATDDGDPAAVVVLPFRVSGDPDLAYLREGLVDLLAARLTGEGGLRAADPRTVHNGWRLLFGDRAADLPADSAVAFARQLGAGHVLLGDVVGTPAGLVLNASVLDARGRTVGRATAQGPQERLAELVDRLVGELLSLSAGEDPQRLAALTSTSLPALRAYLEGQLEYRRGRYEDALLRFSRALDYDSTFALAGLGLGLASGWTSGTDPMRDRGFAVAWRFRERLSQRDRSVLLAQVGPEYPRPPSVRQLIDATRNALDTSPDRAELWYELGDLHFHFGRVVIGEIWREEAERAFRRALELEHDYASPLHHLVALHAYAGEAEALRRVTEEYLARDSVGATADYIRWRVAHALGDAARVAVVLDSMNSETLGWVAINTVDEGFALEDGFAAAELLSERPGTDAQRLGGLMGLHAAELNAALLARARRTIERTRAVQPDPGFADRIHVLSALYGDGDRAAAATAAQALALRPQSRLDRCVLALWQIETRGDPGPPSAAPGTTDPADGTGSERLCEAVLAATVEVRFTGRAGARARGLDSLIATGPVTGPIVDGHSEYAHVALARVLEAGGDLSGALRATRRRVYFIGWNPYLATSLREEARLAEAAGEPEGARRAWTHYLALRTSPEPPLAARSEEARAAIARLSSRAAPR